MPFEKALPCPHCDGTLTRQKLAQGFIYTCLSCGGYAANLPVLENAGVTEEFVRKLWKAARSNETIRDRECPHCGRPMAQVKMPIANETLTLDLCLSCQVVWLDKDEYAKLPHKLPPVREKELPLRAKMALVNAELQELKDRQDEVQGPPDSILEGLLAIFGIPVEGYDQPAGVLPFVTWGLCLVCVLVYTFTFKHLNDIVAAYSFIPNQWYRLGGLTIFTSFFLHGGLIHLISNLYFLLVFGDNAEDSLGRPRFIILLFASHIAGLLISWIMFPNANSHIIGASAGIAGVLGYYTIMFPDARFSIAAVGMAFGFIWLRVPIYVLTIIFVLGEIALALKRIGPYYDTTTLAHLAGIGVGLVWGAIARKPVPND